MISLKNWVEKSKFVLIAEIGVNYYDIATKLNISNMDAAKLMCKSAKDAGIHAVKFQTYKAETIASKYSPSYWDISEEPTTSQYELFKKFDHFGKKEYAEIAAYCREIGINFLSTAFDFESADYLCDFMDFYKISSSDLTNIPFIEYQCKKKKPIILSVGASNEEEIEKAVATIKKHGNELALLHCVLEYPTPYEHTNLRRIQSLCRKYPDLIIGYSDHAKPDLSYDVIKTAYTFGARIIEKHFTLDKTLKGNDHYHAMDPKDAKNILDSIKWIETLSGSDSLDSLESESAARKNARRSIVLTKDVKAGEILTEDIVTFKRPGIGISPSDIKKVLGGKFSRDLSEDSILKYEFIKF